jgi:hypothetical protein
MSIQSATGIETEYGRVCENDSDRYIMITGGRGRIVSAIVRE